MYMYYQLLVAQIIMIGGAAALAGLTIDMMGGFNEETILPIVACGILAAVGYFGAVIAHELGEVNDQLAGRRPELRQWVQRGRDGQQGRVS